MKLSNLPEARASEIELGDGLAQKICREIVDNSASVRVLRACSVS